MYGVLRSIAAMSQLGHISTRYNKVMESLELKEQQIQDYLQQVQTVIQASVAVETNTFNPDQLTEVSQRSDDLGRLARVFSHMVATLEAKAKDLAAARDQLEAVLNVVPGSISWLDQDGVYLGVNQHLAETFELFPENMMGKPINSFNRR